MIERTIRKVLDILLENKRISAEEYEEFVYVLLGDVESFIVTGSIFFLSILADQIIPSMFFLVFFFSLRKRTGGYHLNSFSKCYIGTIILYLIITVMVYFSCQSIGVFVFLAMIAMIIIIILGSVNHPNMDMDDVELQKSKTISRSIVLIEFSFILLLKEFENTEYVIAYLSSAIVLCAILLILAKLTGQEVKWHGKK